MKALLKNLASIRLGYQVRKRITNEEDGICGILTLKDIDQSHIRWDKLFRTNDLVREDFLLKKDDILFPAKGKEMNSIYISEEVSPTIISSYFYIIRIKSRDQVLPGYLSWYLNQSPAQRYINQYIKGTVIHYINISSLEDLPIELPDISIQEKVIEIFKLQNREKELNFKISKLKNKIIKQLLLTSIKD